ncbi:MAG: AEC family transporter [Bdellovibrionales bacterium]|nr:AEC family transporter [Oligoflexia bacterium]
MASFILIFICLALGILLRGLKVFPENTAQVLNRFVIYISLPALTLVQIHRLNLSADVWLPVSMPWLLYALGALVFILLGKILELPRKTVGTLILMGSLGNTSFVGFPLLEAFYGPGSLTTGILIDQPGTFLVASTLGIATAAAFSDHAVKAQDILKKLFSFPPFLSLLLALALRPLRYPEAANIILDRLGSTLIPLSLISVGAQLYFHPEKIKRVARNLSLGLGFKMVVAPLIFYLFYVRILKQSGEITTITLVESAMAPMITSGILVHEYGLDTELGSLLLGIGIPLSLLTVPIFVHFF